MLKNKGSIFTLALLGAFAVGGIGMIALQSHAQIVPSPVAPLTVMHVPLTAESSDKADTDTINDQSGPDKPDITSQVDADKEINDSNATSTTVSDGKQSDTQEHDSATNPNEIEDTN